MFSEQKTIVGMIHVRALPGSPRGRLSVDAIVEHAVHEARLLVEAGVDALMIENMHDVPYLSGQVGPEVVACMTAVGRAVRDAVDLPLGVQILAGAARETMAAALACGAGFIRVENYAYAHVADEGLMVEANAGPLLRYRRQIGAEQIAVWADVKKKHASHSITADTSLAEAAKATEFCGADAVIVTGVATGAPATPEDVATVRDAVRCPVLVGSGVTPENLPLLWPHAHGFIVGSWFKHDGLWSNEIDSQRVGRLMTIVSDLRE